jgi:metallo-beta-lactamase class B
MLASWVTPAEPFRIAGPIFYVGTEGLAAYLIETSEGLIMLDGAMPQSAADIEASVRTLGLDPAEIRLLLITHAHIDHAGTTAHFQALSGAEVAVMVPDVPHIESGGRTDPAYGALPELHFPPVVVDRALADGDTVTLGEVTLTARLGAGHTQGATTWLTTITEDGVSYDVVFPCCTGVNPGMGLVVEPVYPGVADDYRDTFRMLASLRPDIWLAAHTQHFDFARKRARMATKGAAAWVDPEGYAAFIATGEATFEALMSAEVAAREAVATPAP